MQNMQKYSHDRSVKVGIYSRVSTTESRQDINNQLIPLRNWCKSKCYEFEEYIDFISGYSKGEGDSLKRLRNDIRTGDINLVLFYNLDRLSRRGIRDGLNQIEFFRSHKVDVKSFTESFIDPSYPQEIQELIISILLWASQQESKKTSKRIKDTYNRKKIEAEESGKELNWGRKKGSLKIQIDKDKLQRIVTENPSWGYGKIAREFQYWDNKSKSYKTPSKNLIKLRIKQLGVQKNLNNNSR